MKKLVYILMFFSFFPFVSFYNIGTDIQPYAFVVAVLLIFICQPTKVPKMMIPLFFVSAFAIAIYFIYGDYGMSSFRSLYNYMSITVITLATYIGISRIGRLDEKYIKLIINTWFIIGIIQKYIMADFLMFLVAGGRTSASRGITNLTSEPSFYGYMIIFALLFVLDFKKNRTIYILNLLIQLLIFSQSAISIVYLCIYIGLLVIKYFASFKMKKIWIGIVIVVIISVGLRLYFSLYPDSRATVLLNQLISNPIEVYLRDASVSARVDNIVLPINESFNSFLFPKGFASANDVFGFSRIMSGFGAPIYELGIIGVILITNIITIIYKTKNHVNNKLNSIFIFIIMFSAIQLASPTLAFYIGYLLNRQKSRTIGNEMLSIDPQNATRATAISEP